MRIEWVFLQKYLAFLWEDASDNMLHEAPRAEHLESLEVSINSFSNRNTIRVAVQ